MRIAAGLAIIAAFVAGGALAQVPLAEQRTDGQPALTDQPAVGRYAFVSGAVWTAANIFEKENLRRSSPAARFNLAAAYAATGRAGAAVELYRSAARDGAYTTITLDTVEGSRRRSESVNLAGEALRRADRIELASGTIETAAIDDQLALPAGSDPEAETSGIVASEHLPDVTARERDRVPFVPR